MEPAIADDVAVLGVVTGVDEFVGDADVGEQLVQQRVGVEQAVGAVFHLEVAVAGGADGAAGAVLGLDELNPEAAAGQKVGGGQAGDAGADYGYVDFWGRGGASAHDLSSCGMGRRGNGHG